MNNIIKLWNEYAPDHHPLLDDAEFKVEVPNPLPLEVIAKMQDLRNGTHTRIEYLTVEEIKEKYPYMDLSNGE